MFDPEKVEDGTRHLASAGAYLHLLAHDRRPRKSKTWPLSDRSVGLPLSGPDPDKSRVLTLLGFLSVQRGDGYVRRRHLALRSSIKLLLRGRPRLPVLAGGSSFVAQQLKKTPHQCCPEFFNRLRIAVDEQRT